MEAAQSHVRSSLETGLFQASRQCRRSATIGLMHRSKVRSPHRRGRAAKLAPQGRVPFGACVMSRPSIHSSQSFHDAEITQPNYADVWIVQIDGHPQSDRKNGPVNGVEHRKPTARTTIAEAHQTNAD